MKTKYDFPGRRFFVFLVCFMFSLNPGFGFCLPEGESVVSGSASFDRSGENTLNINTPSENLIVNYDSFSIAQPEAVHFYQPSSSAIALNRVVGADPSAIYGLLTANGRIFLINPNGVLFGQGSRVDAAGLVASTLDISNENFLTGNYNFFKNGPGSFVVNQGQINITNGGYAYLLSQGVDNQGAIKADLGKVVLASGEKMTLALDDLNQISVVLDEAVKNEVFGASGEKIESAVKNSGSIIADGGKVLLTAKSLNKVFDYAVNNSGVIQAKTLVSNRGVVELLGEGAAVINKGSITANADEAGKAGEISIISADQTTLDTGSLTEAKASGLAGEGGRILIDSSSGNTSVNAGAVIDVSAGSVSGNAGSVEVSAARQLDFYGILIGRAPLGYLGGTAILDPTDAIVAGTLSANTTVWATNNITITDTVLIDGNFTLNLFADHTSETAGSWEDGAGAILNPNNRRIEAINAQDASLNLKAGSGIASAANPVRIRKINNLTGQINPNPGSAGGINVISEQTNGPLMVGSLTTPAGNINLQNLDSGSIIIDDFDALSSFAIQTDDGSVTIANVGSIDIPGTNSDGIQATGDISLTATSGAADITAGFTAAQSILGNVSFNAGNNIALGQVSSADIIAGANINLTAGNSITLANGSSATSDIGGITLTADNSISLGLLDALGDVTVTALTGTGIITDNNGADVNIIAGGLSLTAPLGINLDTSVDTLTASSTNSAITLREVNGLAVNTINAGTGDVTLTLASGAITDNNLGANNIIANGLSLTAPLGINLDTSINTLTASSTNSDIALREANGLAVNTINAGTGDVTLTLAQGAITDNNGAANNVTADNLQLDAVTGIDLDTGISSLDVLLSGTGNLNIDEADSLAITVADAVNGNITVSAGGTITAVDLVSAAGNISLTSAAGNIAAGILEAQDTIQLTSTSGAISDANGPANNIASGRLILAAALGIDLDTMVNALQAANASGAVNLSNTGNLTLTHLSGLGDYAVSNSGNITIAGSGLLTIADSILSNGGNIILNAAGGITQETLGDVDTSAQAGIAAGSYTANADTDNNNIGAYTLASGGSINTMDAGASGDVEITASDIGLGSASLISAGAGAISLKPSFDGLTPRTIGLGMAIGDFTLNNAAFDSISTTGLVTIGDLNSGDITAEDVAPVSFSILKLITGGAINDIDDIGNAIAISSLALEAGSGIGTISPLNVNVNSLSASTGSGSIFIEEEDDAALGLLSAPVAVQFSAINGAISDANGGLANIIAPDLVIIADSGIGTLDALETEVGRLNALNTTSGDINIANFGDLTVDDFSIGNFYGLENDAVAGSITVTNTGSINIPGTSFSDILADGNITLTALGAGADITAGLEETILIESTSGSVALVAGNDILLGEANETDIFTDNGSITLTAGNNLIVDNSSSINSGSGAISLTASNGSIDLANATGVSSAFGNIALIAEDNIGLGLGVLDTSADVTLSAASLTDDSAGDNDITAENLTLNVDSGMDLDISVNTLTASSIDSDITIREANDLAVNTVNAGTGNVNLSAGSITDNNDADNNITASLLTLFADSGIDLDTEIAALDAIVNGTGDLNIDEADSLILSALNVIDGDIAITADGLLTATDVSALDTDANGIGGNISLTSAAGDIATGILEAQDMIQLTSTSGAITDTNGTANNIASDRLILAAASGIDLDTMVNMAQAENAGGAIDLNNIGGLALTDLNGLEFAILNTGDVTIATSGLLTIADSVLTNGGNLVLNAAGGITQEILGDVDTSAQAGIAAGSYTANADSDNDYDGAYILGDGGSVNTAGVDANGGDIEITAADIELGLFSSISAGNADISLTPSFNNTTPRTIGLGSAIGDFTLASAEIEGISTLGRVIIGDPDSGDILVDDLAPLGFSLLELVTGGSVNDTDNIGNAVTISDLTLRTDSIGTEANPLDILVDTLTEDIAPFAPTELDTDHSTEVWSNNNLIGASWTRAVDPNFYTNSGIAGYSFVWNTTADTIPDTTPDIGDITSFSSLLPDSNSNYLHIRSQDKAGNWSEAIHLGPFKIDTVAPVISATRSILANANGWNNSDVTVSFSGSDDRSGVDTITGSILLSLEGANQLATGTVTDLAGNQASITETINIDKTAPVISIINPVNGSTVGTSQTLLITAAPDLSGIAGITPASGTVFNEGTHNIIISAEDLAGNISQELLSFTITSDFIESQLTNASVLRFLLSNPQTFSQFQLNSFDAIGPVYFYHPLTPVDMSAYEEFSLEEGAYEFIEGSIKLRGQDQSPILEDGKKKGGKKEKK